MPEPTHPALEALRAVVVPLQAYEGTLWERRLENLASSVRRQHESIVRAAIPALEALLESERHAHSQVLKLRTERAEMLAALEEIIANARLAPPTELFAREVLQSRGRVLVDRQRAKPC